jgi:hypothetical protein
VIKCLISAAYKYGYDLNIGVANDIVPSQNAKEWNEVSGISQRTDIIKKSWSEKRQTCRTADNGKIDEWNGR